MSKIGANIRKIRTIKALNQSEFADLFGLTRASIGAYEEGRAEPKIDAAIEIANYFSISLNDIFVKDLTVNQLTKFPLSEKSALHAEVETSSLTYRLQYVSPEMLANKQKLIELLTKRRAFTFIDFPLLTKEGEFYFNLDGLLISGIAAQTEAVLCSLVDRPKNGELYFCISAKTICVGRFIKQKNKIETTDSTEDIELLGDEKLFKLEWIISPPQSDTTNIEKRLHKIEKRLYQLESPS